MIDFDYENDEMNQYIIDNQFIPCVNWFKMSINQSYILISEYQRWKKMSFGNRCVLSGGNGMIPLSIPVENGRDQKCLFKDVRIANKENWQPRHWRTLVSCYNRSPYFEYYQEGFRPFFEKKYDFLIDLNLAIIQTCIDYLAVNKRIMLVSDDKFPIIDTEDNFLTPRTYSKVPDPVKYHQLFEDRVGFLPNLSLVDLLFMEGPNAKSLLS